MEKFENTNNDNIKNDFLNYLRTNTKIKLDSTHKQYVKWLDKVQNWFIENGICSTNYVIWKDLNQINEIDQKLHNEYKEIWEQVNDDPKQNGWLSAPWNHWVKFNSKNNLELPSKSIEILSKRIKEIKPFTIKDFRDNVIKSGLYYSEQVLLRFVASLITKPFVILTGLSGSGKTKLAVAFAKYICEDEKQICIIPVGADWTNREPLLGFPNALEPGKYIQPENGALELIIKASNPVNKDKPYFLILDEMNLSHVERYFADFLSAMESNEALPLHSETDDWKDTTPAKIKLPKNLFIIGTVNIDETTYMFSPKVLDRANVIEFRITDSEMKSYLEEIKPLNLDSLTAEGSNMGSSFVSMAIANDYKFAGEIDLKAKLIEYFNILKKSGAEFGYRSASEIIRFAGVVNKLDAAWGLNEIVDVAIMQKLLPKVHGSRKKLAPVLTSLGEMCLVDRSNIGTYFDPKNESNLSDDKNVMYPISLEKIVRMYRSLIENSFTSYAEA